MKTKATNIRLPADVWDIIQALAEDNDRTLSAEIRIAIRHHLAGLSADALSGSEEHRVSSRLASGQGNAAEDGE